MQEDGEGGEHQGGQLSGWEQGNEGDSLAAAYHFVLLYLLNFILCALLPIPTLNKIAVNHSTYIMIPFLLFKVDVYL